MKKRMFKLSMLLLVAALVGCLIAATAFAAEIVAEGKCGENLTWTLDDEGTLVISGEGEMKDYFDRNLISGPNTVAPWVVRLDNNIKKVIVNEGVTSIGRYAFQCCYTLETVSLPNSLTKIGNAAFYMCDKIEEITIPDSVTEMGTDVFILCGGLKSVKLSNRITEISGGMFSLCPSLTSVVIPDGVTSIGSYAFCGCKSLVELVIPESVDEVGTEAFAETPWQDIKAAENDNYFIVKGNLVYYGGQETELVVPSDKGIKSIADKAFYYDEALTKITLPEGITELGSTFEFSRNLKEVVLPDGMIKIGSDCFFGCKELESITIPESVNYIGAAAFEGCAKLNSISLPKGITDIKNYTFLGCKQLTALVVPASVKSIARQAFSAELKDIYYLGTKEQWESVEIGSAIDRNNVTITAIDGKTIHFLGTAGDASGDGKLTNTDLVAVARYCVGIDSAIPSDFIIAAADMNNDGAISNSDIVAMAKMIVA